jgi:hypothetical protein
LFRYHFVAYQYIINGYQMMGLKFRLS